MTRDEAIIFLDDISWGMGSMAMESWNDKTGAKVREAIEALGPETCTITTYIDGKGARSQGIYLMQWIPVSERLPDNTDPVNITWVNHDPEPYYADIKDRPFTATGHYCNGRWWWYSVTCQDYLDEYGRWDIDAMDDAIEVIAWMPLPKPYKPRAESKGEQHDT